jgi:two-component system, chemotaxis family, CheB/CheR fusion protein
MTPLRNGEFYGYAKIARDQTQRKLDESRRAAQLTDEQARRGEAQVANAMKDEFLAIMSHELRHPLNLIHINAELLTRMPDIVQSPLSMRAARIIRDAVISQAKIIDDLLDLSRVNTGKLAVTLSDVDLRTIAESIVEVTRADPAAAGLDITISGEQQDMLIHADRVRVEQVLLNLLSNAVKFTPAGGRINVELRREGEMARIDVSDNGQGIAPEFLPRVFDMFGQASAMTVRSKGGLGIGLTLVQHIAALHGGRVEAASEGLGRGTRLSVWFPLYGNDGAQRPLPGRSTSAGVADLSILLVDDMEDAIRGLRTLLELEGATVHAATSAPEALKILDEHHVDLLVSDIAMPGMDGYTLIREVRKKPRYARLPAIAATGLGRLEDAERGREAGFSAHISKPILLDVLIRTAVELCRKRSWQAVHSGENSSSP